MPSQRDRDRHVDGDLLRDGSRRRIPLVPGNAPGVGRLATSDLTSTVGDAVFNVSAMWIVYSTTGSILTASVVQVLWQTPSALFGAFAGVMVDRGSPHRILVNANWLSALTLALLATYLLLTDSGEAVAILLVVFLLNVLVTVMSPARYVLIPRLVRTKDLASVNGLLSSIQTGGMLLGNALAGLVLVSVGRVWGFVLDSITFFVGAILVRSIDFSGSGEVEADTGDGAKSVRGALSEIINWILASVVVRLFVIITLLVNISSFVGPLYPALVKERLHAGAGVYGLIEAASVVGAILGGVAAGRIERRWGAGRVFIWGIGACGLAMLGVAISQVVAITVILEIVVGLTTTTAAIGVGSVTQSLVPESMRGRLGGFVRSSGAFAVPAATLLGGWAADDLGPHYLFGINGLYMLLISGLAYCSRSLRTCRLMPVAAGPRQSR